MKQEETKTLPQLCEEHWANFKYSSEDHIKKMEAQGYEGPYSGDFWVLREYNPAYSSQTSPRHIGKEPEYSCRSYDSHQYHTFYYEVTREQYEAMPIKPELTPIHRPIRLHNFDGFTEVIQEARDGMGWTEKKADFHSTTTYKYFVI